MSGWAAKRFWSVVSVQPVDGAYQVFLDKRPVKTPAKAALSLPTLSMAEAVAEEWRAVEEVIDPRKMPVTRAANAAIDKVSLQFDEVADLIAAYGGSDLICYRAERPAELVAEQSAAWDPLLDWSARQLGAPLVASSGIVPVTQPAASLAAMRARVFATTPFQLTALHDLVSLSGSLVIGLAATEGAFPVEDLWSWSRIDEDWQARLWGEDEESSENAALRRKSFLSAYYFWNSCSG